MLHSYVIHGNNKKSNIKSITISRTISFKKIIVRRHNSDFIDPKWTEKQLKAISIVLHVISYQKIGTQWVHVSIAVNNAGWMLVDGSRICQPDLVAFVGQLSGSCTAANMSSWIVSSLRTNLRCFSLVQNINARPFIYLLLTECVVRIVSYGPVN